MLAHRWTDKDLIRTGLALDSRCDINGSSNGRVVASLLAAERADNSHALVNAYSYRQFNSEFFLAFFVQCLDKEQHLGCAIHGFLGLIPTCQLARSTEHHHNGVADELINSSAIAVDDVRHAFHKIIEHNRNPLGAKLFTELGKSHDIAEENRDERILRFLFKPRFAPDDLLDNIGRQEALQNVLLDIALQNFDSALANIDPPQSAE